MVFKTSIEFSQTASTNIKKALSYISDTLSNPGAASRLGKLIENKINIIKSFPESCPVIQNESIKNVEVRKATIDSYVLYYTINRSDNSIYVINFVHGRQSLEELIILINN